MSACAAHPRPDALIARDARITGTVRAGPRSGGHCVQFEELRYVCQQAAIDVLAKRGRPVPPTVVLPTSERTQLLTLPELPDDDEARHAVLAQLATDRLTAQAIPCWGFLAEAEVGGDEAMVVVYGARRHAPHLTASRFDDDALSEFAPAEPLDPTALPFLHPLQHAVDALPTVSDDATDFDAFDPKRSGPGGLPQHP